MFCIRDRTVRISPDQSTCSSDTGDILIPSTRIQSGPVRITVHRLNDPVQSPRLGPSTDTRPESSVDHKSRSTVQTSTDPDVCSHHHHHPYSSPSSGAPAVVETSPVTMVTHCNDQLTDQTRNANCQSLSLANQSQAAAMRDNEAPEETKCLKAKMKLLLMQPEDPMKTTRPGLVQVPSQNQRRPTTKQARTQQNRTQTQQNHLQSQQHQSRTQQNHLQSHQHTRTQQNHLQSQQHQSRTQQNRHQSQPHQTQTQQNHLQSQQHQTQTPQRHLQSQQHQTRMQQTHLQSQQHQTQTQTQQKHLQSQQHQTQQNYLQSQQHQTQTQQNYLQSQQHQTQTQQNYLQSQQDQTQTQENHLQSQQHQTRTQQNHLQSQQHQTQTQQNHLQSQQHQTQSHQKHLQFQQNLTRSPKEQTIIQQNLYQSKQNQPSSQQDQTQNQKKQIQFQQNETQTSKNQTPSEHNTFQPPENQTQFQDYLFHTRQDPSHHTFKSHNPVTSLQVQSPLEEAGQVLHWVRRRRKLLEENLEAQLRVKTGEVLYCQLEALSANRDWTEEVHIKKTVDTWIRSLTTDIQAEMASEDATRCRPANITTSAKPSTSRISAHSVQGRPVTLLRGAGGRQTAAHRASGRQRAGPDSREVESYLSHLYGRAPHDGVRRTMKKSPYLRFKSPASPQSHKPRPRLVESVRGVPMKSCKTQTSLVPPPPLAPEQPVPQCFSSTHLTSGDSFGLPLAPSNIYPVAMAIPLGRPRIKSSSRHQQEATSVHPGPPTSSIVATNYEEEEEPIEDGEAPTPISSPLPSNPLYVMETKGEEEEEENVFPGTEFVSVIDVAEEEVPQDIVQLDGGPAPPPVRYQGPVFPPQPPAPLSSLDQVPLLGSDLNSDTLENRLVDWVEQQLMSRLISEMYCPPPADPALNHSTDQSEQDEQSVTSNVMEAGEGANLLIFMGSNISVDSDILRNLVHEVLTETVALMLGQRDSLQTELDRLGPEPGPAASQEDPIRVLQVPTPQVTPPSSPTLLSKEAPALITPPPSEPPSLNEEPYQPITEPEPVATPTSSPEPPVGHQATPPLTWEDTELPLSEERPEEEEHVETHSHPVVQTVAEEEPPLSIPPPPPPESPPSPDSASGPSSTLEDNSASSSSSAVTSAKHISEGEVLSSALQGASITEEARLSFSGSLQELQEMDCDPLSESQVKGHEDLLDLMVKMARREPRPQPEGSRRQGQEGEDELSIGEVRECERTSPGEIGLQAANQGVLNMDLSLTLPPPHLEGDPGLVFDQTWVMDAGLLREGVKGTQRNGDEDKEEEGGVRRVIDVHVPSIRSDTQDQDQEDVNQADTESSNDIF